MEKELVILGNGFDIFCGLETSFKYFSIWLKNEDALAYGEIEKYWGFETNDEWNTIERKIYDKHCLSVNKQDLNKEIRKFKRHFKKYLLQQVIPNINPNLINDNFYRVEDIKGLLNDKPIINFNYTMTIERLFDCNDVYHIHGVIGNEKYCEDICLGYDIFSNKLSDTRSPRNKRSISINSAEDANYALSEQTRIQSEYYTNKITQLETFKEMSEDQFYQARINNYKNFDIECSNFENYQKISIFGHSLGDSDKFLVEALSKFEGEINIIDFWSNNEERDILNESIKQKLKRDFTLLNSNDYKM